MQVMRFATRAHIESVFEENHALWGGPFTREEYRDYWFSLFLTPWGASNFRYMALTEEEDGPLLSTLKLYRFTGTLFAKPVVIAGIGAVYTPREQRTFGHASLLVGEVLDYMQKKKAALAILYTEIGLPFYERLGFQALPCFETTGPLAPPPGSGSPGSAPGIEVRDATIRDARILAAYHRELSASAPLSIDRDPTYWEFILFRRLRFWEASRPSAGKPVSLIALRDGKVVASAFAVVSAEGVHLDECGSLPHGGEGLRAILDRIWLAGLEMGGRRWRGRLPAGIAAQDDRLRGERAPAGTSIPMVAPLGATQSLQELVSDTDGHLLGLDHV